ncbi:MAG TPA: KH domain-containing protein [Anaerolineae bacterium]|nr:KH domain-containing protein [Anaerolineae bacterium]HQK13300.1 KH domain-containing protein [Anaerolineae bacterium]
MSAVKDLVEYVTKALADKPGAVKISEIEGETSIMLELRVSPDDMGRMIGREGRTINAMRSLARVLGAKLGKKVTLEIV